MKSIFNRIPLVLTAVFVLLAAVRPNVALAQNAEKTVSGTVLFSDATPVVGAFIYVKDNTSKGTTADIDGKYSISVPDDAVLVFSFMGTVTQELSVKGKTTLDVVLAYEAETLDEMVVIGYGSVRKSDLTGAVSVVKTDEFKNKMNLSIGDALQGLAAGVNVRSGGDIGSLPSIQIRGTGNLTNNDPLYVIDGMPTSNSVEFNVDDIESIQVLKDASAAAIYGSRAANGVIIITTKKGKSGETKIEFSTKLSVQNLPRMKFAQADEWKKVYDLAFDNSIADGYEGVTKRMNHWDNNTDWQKEFFKTGFVQEYNLGFSNGNENGNYRVSFNYLDNSGVTLGRNMSRITARVNSETRKGRLSFGETLLLGHTKTVNNGGSFTSVVRMIPTIPVYAKTESELTAATTAGFGRGSTDNARSLGSNPVAEANTGESYTNTMRIQGNAFAQLDIMDWLKYKLSLGTTISDYDSRSWTPGYSNALNGSDGQSSASARAGRSYHNVVENTLNFDKVFGKHKINAVLGMTYEHSKLYTSSVTKNNLISTASGEFFKNVDSATSLTSGGGNTSENALISYLARVNYDYSGKYLLSLTVRRDGSSRFASGYRWGTFPSASFAWRISEENFFNVPWINDLKIRANYGTLGSQNVGNYDYQMFVNSYAQYRFDGEKPSMGQAIVDLSNSNLAWETLTQQNYGVDVAFLQNRLQVSAEYFDARSKDVLTTLKILATTGSESSPYVNAASISNRGVELSVTWRDVIGDDFSYSISGNISHTKNILNDFGYGKLEEYTSRCVTRVGHAIGAYYLIETDGLFQSEEEVLNYKSADGKVIQPNAKPGDIRFKDANGDGQITDADRVVLDGKSPWPKVEAGLSIMAQYKGFDMTISGYGSFGQWAYNNTRMYTDNLNDCANLRAGQPWWGFEGNKTNNAWYPRPLYSNPANSAYYIDRWIENSSFFKISTLSIGYTLKAPASVKHIFDNVRFSLTGQNLITFTKYTGYDPDFIGSLFEPGVDYQAQPAPKSIIFAVNLNF